MKQAARLHILFISLIVVGIFSYAEDRAKACIEKLLLHPDGVLFETFFIPADKPVALLLAFIEHEQKSIKAALFNFTDNDVAQALAAAHDRGVKIEVIADVEALRARQERVTDLYAHQIPVYLYARYRSLMHNKFFIFESTMGNKQIVWTGSANITMGGLTTNEENVLVCDNAKMVADYTNNFERIKRKIEEMHSNKLVKLRDHCMVHKDTLFVQIRRNVIKEFVQAF